MYSQINLYITITHLITPSLKIEDEANDARLKGPLRLTLNFFLNF